MSLLLIEENVNSNWHDIDYPIVEKITILLVLLGQIGLLGVHR